jgi:hypothetical protein
MNRNGVLQNKFEPERRSGAFRLNSTTDSFAKLIFPAKFFFCISEKGILAGKSLFFKRVNLLCKEGFSFLFTFEMLS